MGSSGQNQSGIKSVSEAGGKAAGFQSAPESELLNCPRPDQHSGSHEEHRDSQGGVRRLEEGQPADGSLFVGQWADKTITYPADLPHDMLGVSTPEEKEIDHRMEGLTIDPPNGTCEGDSTEIGVADPLLLNSGIQRQDLYTAVAGQEALQRFPLGKGMDPQVPPSIGAASHVSTSTIGRGPAHGLFIVREAWDSEAGGKQWSISQDEGGRRLKLHNSLNITGATLGRGLIKRPMSYGMASCFRCSGPGRQNIPPICWATLQPVGSDDTKVSVLDVKGKGISTQPPQSSEATCVSDERVSSIYRPLCISCLDTLERGEDDGFRIAKMQDEAMELFNRPYLSVRELLVRHGSLCDVQDCTSVGFPHEWTCYDKQGGVTGQFYQTTCDDHALRVRGPQTFVWRQPTAEVFEEIEEAIPAGLSSEDRVEHIRNHPRWTEYLSRKCPGTSQHGHECFEDKLPAATHGLLCTSFLRECQDFGEPWTCNGWDDAPCGMPSATWMSAATLGRDDKRMPMCSDHEEEYASVSACLSCGLAPGEYGVPGHFIIVPLISPETGGHCLSCFKRTHLGVADPSFFRSYQEAKPGSFVTVERGAPWIAAQSQRDIDIERALEDGDFGEQY